MRVTVVAHHAGVPQLPCPTNVTTQEVGTLADGTRLWMNAVLQVHDTVLDIVWLTGTPAPTSALATEMHQLAVATARRFRGAAGQWI